MAVAPCVHMNGTSADHFIRYYKRAEANLRAALDDMQEVAPNMRDFYVMEGGGKAQFEMAVDEHLTHVQNLRTLIDDLREIRGSIADQTRGST